MKLLEYIASNPSIDDLRSRGLIFSAADKDSMLAKQEQIDKPFRIAPIELTDGRWAICCDTLTEISPGVYQELFAALDTDKLATAEMLPWADVLALLLVTEGTPTAPAPTE